MVSSRIAALVALLLLWCAAAVADVAGPAALVLPGDGPVIEYPAGEPCTSVGAETASDVPADHLGALDTVPELPVTLGAPGGEERPLHASACLDGPRRPPR